MKFNSAGKIFIVGLAVMGAVTIYACSCSCTDSQQTVPDPVLKSSNRLLFQKRDRNVLINI